MAKYPDLPLVKVSDSPIEFCRFSERSVAATPHPRLTRYKVVFLEAQMLFYSMESQADASQELRVGKSRKDKTNGTDDLEDAMISMDMHMEARKDGTRGFL
jgi:hypothetical protein